MVSILSISLFLSLPRAILSADASEGCCYSRSEGPNAPHPGGAASSPPSARPISTQPRRQPNIDEPHPRTSDTSSHQQRQPLSQHIDKPLRRREWEADRPWTRNDLDIQRAEFFDTRVTGRQEIWQVLKSALELLYESDSYRDVGETDASESLLATAQGILIAAEVTLPTGDLVNGAYDSLGNYYALPKWVVSDPKNLTEDSGAQKKDAKPSRKADEDLGEEDTAGEDVEDESDEALRRREEKGKAVVDVKNLIKVRARLSDNSPDVIISLDVHDPIRSLAQKIAEACNLPRTKRIRVAYMGKILKENASLQNCSWQKDHVVNALIFNR
ncbi:ubiquitin domain-containing protein [Xylariaceae sp. FL0255]|nr:ubiquitin domain-containing protein [Xylariaceae sp. FL0255]